MGNVSWKAAQTKKNIHPHGNERLLVEQNTETGRAEGLPMRIDEEQAQDLEEMRSHTPYASNPVLQTKPE